MSEEALFKNLMVLGSGIEACLENDIPLPALILLYSAIDTIGWLDSDQGFATRDSFTNWAENYLLRAKPLGCSALDLYGARCGLLHTFTPDSKLSTEGRALRACYAWGNAKVEDLRRTIELAGTGSPYFAIHINDLYDAWRLGLAAFVEHLDDDPPRAARVHAKAKQFFIGLGVQPVTELLDAVDQK